MGSKLSGLGSALYDSKRKEVLGRDGAGWGKLGTFYFFFYLGLAGFFCAMLAVFMALTPRDHPYYTSHDSRMETRSNPLSPGLGFRPQPDVERNLILAEKIPYSRNAQSLGNDTARFVNSLDKYLQVYYWKNAAKGNRNSRDRSAEGKEFSMNNPGECSKNYNYGYGNGKPCVLVKMNKIVDFVPSSLASDDDDAKSLAQKGCRLGANAVPIICQGEYPADIDNIGSVRYMSESGQSSSCGMLEQSHFPYAGKQDRKDVYQAPYIWVQFTNPTPNVLINVICRAYAANIDYDKKTGRGLTRFQIFVEDQSKHQRKSGDL